MTTVEFRNATTPVHRPVGAHRVFTRAHWDEEWELAEHLECREAVWCCAPALPTATLEFRYGEILRPGARRFALELKASGLLRRFVKIEIDDSFSGFSWTSKDWYGLLEIEADTLHGAWLDDRHAANPAAHRLTATGRQTFLAYGLEKLLVDHVIRHTFWWRDPDVLETLGTATFNRRGRKNRSAAKQTEDPFDPTPRESYVFDPEYKEQEHANWSSLDIVEYLIKRQTPRDRLGQLVVPFTLGGNQIPAWDAPEIDQAGQTTYSLIDRLVNRRRLLGWHLAVNGSDEIELRTFTFAPSDVQTTVPNAAPIPANTLRVELVFDSDPLTQCALKTSDVAAYDQVIVQGAPRISVGSFSYRDDTLEDGWVSSLQTRYDEGATNAASYATMRKKADKQAAHADVRNSPLLDDVYSLFVIPADWNRTVGDGDGGAVHPLFTDDLGGPTPIDVYPEEMHVQRILPLLVGVDYSLDRIKTGAIVETNSEMDERLGPLVFFKRPNPDDQGNYRWAQAEELGQPYAEMTRREENYLFSCQVRVPPESQAIKVKVAGQPQHAIAHTVFVAIPQDDDKRVAKYRYDGNSNDGSWMIATLALPDGRRFEERWPAVEPADQEACRYKILFAGDGFERITVAPGTVVDVDADGRLVRSTGGEIVRPTNGRDILRGLARMAYEWFGQPRRALELVTRRLDVALRVGDLITQVGPLTTTVGPPGHRTTVNTPITQIAITIPEGRPEPEAAESPVMRVTTDAGELDPFAFVSQTSY